MVFFGLFDLTGLRFSPRIRDLDDQRLWRLATTPTGDGAAAALLHHRIQPDRFLDRWDDLLRVAATIRHGHTPASLLVSRLQPSARQNDLTRAIQEYGRVIKTISILRYLHNDKHRRRIHAQLNKGESLTPSAGSCSSPTSDDSDDAPPDHQDLQAQCLTLLTNAVVCSNTIYLAAATDHVAHSGHEIPDEALRRLSPTAHEHINLYGRYDFTNPTTPPPANSDPSEPDQTWPKPTRLVHLLRRPRNRLDRLRLIDKSLAAQEDSGGDQPPSPLCRTFVDGAISVLTAELNNQRNDSRPHSYVLIGSVRRRARCGAERV